MLCASSCRPTMAKPEWTREHEPIAQLGRGDCIVDENGRVACASKFEALPTKDFDEPVVQLASNGAWARCAVLKSGRLACWGCTAIPGFGDLSRNADTTLRQAKLRFLELPPVREVAIGAYGMCALTHSGQVSCWGFRAYDESAICQGPRLVGAQTLASGIVHIALSRDGPVCSVDAANLMRCTEISDHEDVLTLQGVKRVAAGATHFCALTELGAVICWGENSYGQCAAPREACKEWPTDSRDPVSYCRVEPHQVSLPGPAIDVTAGPSHSCAVLRDGRVFCWGYDQDAALGFASETECPNLGPAWRAPQQPTFCALSPRAVTGIRDAVRVQADKNLGRVHTWALLSNGSAVAWPLDKKRP